MTNFRLPINFSGFTPPPIIPPDLQIDSQAGGWADLHPDGPVTGGAGGQVLIYNQDSSYLANNGVTYFGWEALWEQMRDNRWAVQDIYWDGPDEIQLPVKDYRIEVSNGNNSNSPRHKTISFTRGQMLRGGSFVFGGWYNIVLRNWKRTGDGDGDGKTGESSMKGIAFRNCERIWVDHFEIDGEATIAGTEMIKDGSLDISMGSNNITISNSYIRRSFKTMLCGSGPNNESDPGKLDITFRNCLFENNIDRQPLAYNGRIHLLNNLFQYVPKYTNSPTQQDYARIATVFTNVQFYSQGNMYYGHRWCHRDSDYQTSNPNSGLISDNDGFDPDPTFSTFLTGGGGGLYPPVGSIRPENVTWNPNTLEGYIYPVPLMTPAEAEAYALLNAGANLIINPPV
jgi:pectate lyase